VAWSRRASRPRCRVVLVCTAVALSASATNAVAAATGREPSCRVRKCRTLVANRQAVVFLAVNRSGKELPYRSSFVRWVPSGRVTRLGDEEPGVDIAISISRPVVAARFVGYALQIFSHSEQTAMVCRLDAQRGHRQCVFADQNVEGAEGGRVQDLVLTPGGTVAWIAGGPGSRVPVHDVYELLPGAKVPVLLASAASVEGGSLAASATHLYWTEAGAVRTATIP
jgi:hypothetical protein